MGFLTRYEQLDEARYFADYDFWTDYAYPDAGRINTALSLLERAYFWIARDMSRNWMHGANVDWVAVEQLRQNYMYVSRLNDLLPPGIRHEDRRLEFPCRLGAEARTFRKRLYDEGRWVPDTYQRQSRARLVHYSLRTTTARASGPGYFREEDISSDESYMVQQEDSSSESSTKRRRV